MIVGVFAPVINSCGGAEWVAVNIINSLKRQGHQVIVLTDMPLNQGKFEHIFNRRVLADQQVVLPLRFFSPANYHNIYTDVIRCLLLKSKCNVIVDTFSNALLPGVDVSYIHHPLLKKVRTELPYLRNKVFFLLYEKYLNYQRNVINRKLVFANSEFTADAVRTETGVDPYVLYPAVSNEILNGYVDFDIQRDNNAITVARIAPGKNLEIIPYIAKSTCDDISFTILGLLDDVDVLNSLRKLIRELHLSKRVKILVNVKRERLERILFNSKVYLHPKIDEHFGVSIIEGMAAGCIPVVHNSGGPKEFVPQSQRFRSVAEAAAIVERVMSNWSPTQAQNVSKDAEKFGENNFSKQFIDFFNSHFL